MREGTPVQAVERDGQGVVIRSARHGVESFDQVIFACHSDDALRLLSRPTVAKRAALSDLTYQDNHVILHCDETQMPKRKACWSSWVYKADDHDTRRAIGVTYWMNRLQNIPETDPVFISLNPARPVHADLIYDEITFRHPVFDQAAIRAQGRLVAIQGQNRTWFAGAYLRNGFHEDGFASAMRVARALDRVEA